MGKKFIFGFISGALLLTAIYSIPNGSTGPIGLERPTYICKSSGFFNYISQSCSWKEHFISKGAIPIIIYCILGLIIFLILKAANKKQNDAQEKNIKN